MFLFKYECIKCKYNISLRVNFYDSLTFLLKFKNPVNTSVRYFYAHFFFFSSLWAFVFDFFFFFFIFQAVMEDISVSCIFPLDFSVLYLNCARILRLPPHCLSASQSPHNHLMCLDPSGYILSSPYLIWRVCTFTEMYIVDLLGWMVCTACL